MSNPSYEYSASLVRVIDGDTVVLNFDLGFKTHVEQTCRLLGINTPELIGEQHEAGKAAKQAVVDALTTAVGNLIVRTHKPEKKDKYGRYLAEILYTDTLGTVVSLNEWLIAQGFAVPYNP
jgi:micrococcal nuclease